MLGANATVRPPHGKQGGYLTKAGPHWVALGKAIQTGYRYVDRYGRQIS
jgi:hypothetical protein